MNLLIPHARNLTSQHILIAVSYSFGGVFNHITLQNTHTKHRPYLISRAYYPIIATTTGEKGEWIPDLHTKRYR
jgi:hypothetical protein